MNRWWILIVIFCALTAASFAATAQVTPADDRASQFVIGDTTDSETYNPGLGATLLSVGALFIMGSLITLALSAHRYNKTRIAATEIVRQIPSMEDDS